MCVAARQADASITRRPINDNECFIDPMDRQAGDVGLLVPYSSAGLKSRGVPAVDNVRRAVDDGEWLSDRETRDMTSL